MTEKKTFAVAEVKAAESENPNGEFEVILSAETVDRDGEVIDAKAFEPLPDSIPFHAFHDFHDPIGRGVPFYDGDVLQGPRHVRLDAPRAGDPHPGRRGRHRPHVGRLHGRRPARTSDDAPHITAGELLEGSFVSVPATARPRC